MQPKFGDITHHSDRRRTLLQSLMLSTVIVLGLAACGGGGGGGGGTPSISPPPPPPPPPATGTLIFTGDNGTGISVFAVEDNGTGTRKLSDSTAASDRTVSDVQVSPDEEWVAFIADPTGENQLYVNEVAGGSPIRVNRVETNGTVTTTVKSFDWSPDSQQLVFAADLDNRTPRGDGTNSFANEIYVIDRNGANENKISGSIGTNAKVDLRTPVWSPVLPYILQSVGPIGAGFDQANAINLHALEGGFRNSSRQATGASFASAVKWSGNGVKFAFVVDEPRAGSATLYVGNVALGGPDRRSGFGSFNNRFAWSPIGQEIVFTDLDLTDEMFLFSGGSSGPISLGPRIAYDLSLVTELEWSPTGSTFGYLERGALKTAAPGQRTADTLLSSSGQQVVERYQWSPDGSKIAAIGNLNGLNQYELFVLNADGSGLISVALDIGNNQISNEFAWSPDGTQIAFSAGAARNDPDRIYIAEADGSGVSRVSDASISDIGEIAYISN